MIYKEIVKAIMNSGVRQNVNVYEEANDTLTLVERNVIDEHFYNSEYLNATVTRIVVASEGLQVAVQWKGDTE